LNDDDGSTFIALRYDKTHVLFRLGDNGDFVVEPEVDAMFHKLPVPISEYGGAETSEPDTKIRDSIREHFEQAHVGEQWLLEVSSGSRIPVTVQKPIELVWGCDYHSYSAGFIAEVPPSLQSAFAALPQNYFLIHKAAEVPPPVPNSKVAHVAKLPKWTPPPGVLSQIEQAIVLALKGEVTHEEARGAYGKLPKQFEEDAALGKAKLSYEVHALQLAPDGLPRLFVHARWMVNQRRALWLSSRSGTPLREDEVGFGQLGSVLNVFDRPDGYGDALIYFQGYEGYNIHLFRYTDAGLVATRISHGDGC
jgi:hypothetical protein